MSRTAPPVRRSSASAHRRNRHIAFIASAAVLAIILVVIIIVIVSNAGVKPVTKLRTESTETSVKLSWTGSGKKLSYDVFQKGPYDNDFSLATNIPAGSTCEYTASGLDSATPYDFRVVSVKGEGENAKRSEGTEISAYTVPRAIGSASAFTQNKNSLTISFVGVDAAPVFELRYGSSPESVDENTIAFTTSNLSFNPNDNTSNFMLTGLVEGNTYYFSIRSLAGNDNYSNWSPVFSGKVTRAVDMTGIDINRPMVALTFDDGPDASDITYRILDALNAVGGKGTFFQLGQLAENMPDRIKRIVDEGHEIGSHTYDHKHMGNSVNQNDIVSANDAIERVCGVRPTAFRSPGGETTDTIRSICSSEDTPLYYWTVDTRDWESKNVDAIVRNIQSSVDDGDIMLLHNIYETSAKATEIIIPWLVEQGYQLVTVSQLVQAKTGSPPVPGVQYYSGWDTN